MKKAAVFFAEGFEEVEALTVVDLLRRAQIQVDMISIADKQVTGAHGISIMTDRGFDEGDNQQFDLLVLPGGMPGTLNLKACAPLCELLNVYAAQGKKIAAICAAPSVFGELGLLKGKEAVCYPGFEEKLLDAVVKTDRVCVDGNITTGRGMGTAIPFALSLIEQLLDSKTAADIKKAIIFGHE